MLYPYVIDNRYALLGVGVLLLALPRFNFSRG